MGRSILTLVCLFVISAVGHTDEISLEHKLLQSVTNSFIKPAHQVLAKSTEMLEQNSRQFCQNINQLNYSSVQQSWFSAMNAWSAIAPINFGPIDDSNATWRFQFWPDQINLVHRKFKSRIQGRNQAILAKDLAQASVAIQGLSALEYLLFDEAGTLAAYQSKPHLCTILIATSENLHANAAVLTASWVNDYPQRWFNLATQSSKSDYLKRQVETVFSGLVMALGNITNQKLGKALGYKKNNDKKSKQVDETKSAKLNPWLLESWRSETSLKNIHSTLKSGHILYTTKQGLSDYLVAKGKKYQSLDQEIRELFQANTHLVKTIEISAFQNLKNNMSGQLELLHKNVHRLYRLLKIDYAKAANILFRFNAHDGD